MEIRKSFLLSLVYLSKLEGSYLQTAKSELKKILELLDTVDLTIGNEVADAFDPNINRKLTSQTPPRPVELSSVEQSFKEYKLLIQRLHSICDVNDYPSVNSLMNYFFDFGAHLPYPDAFSRSKLNVSMETLFQSKNTNSFEYSRSSSIINAFLALLSSLNLSWILLRKLYNLHFGGLRPLDSQHMLIQLNSSMHTTH